MMKRIILILLAVFATGSVTAVYLAIAYPTNRPGMTAQGDIAATAAGSSATASGGGYTLTEIAPHSSESDCWIIVRGKVYDVTTYIPSHPGGRRNITNVCGNEVTSVFAAIHSNRAWDLLGSYRIGNVTTGPANTPAPATPTTSAADMEQVVMSAVTDAFPGATVLSVHPFGGGYTALVSVDNTLVDVVTDAEGMVLSQDARRDGLEWFWSSDDDEIEEWYEHEDDESEEWYEHEDD